MPPYKVKVNCLSCRFARVGYAIATMDKGDKHAQKMQHVLDIWRLSQPPHYIGQITPRGVSSVM